MTLCDTHYIEAVEPSEKSVTVEGSICQECPALSVIRFGPVLGYRFSSIDVHYTAAFPLSHTPVPKTKNLQLRSSL